jgi:hypothetical protein
MRSVPVSFLAAQALANFVLLFSPPSFPLLISLTAPCTPRTLLVPHAPCTMHHAPCSMLHAPRTTHHAPCTLHHAPCTMHHAPCTVHLAPTHHVSPQLRTAQGGLAMQDGRPDLLRTPRRRNQRDRDGGKSAGGSGRRHHNSRSRSPPRRTPQGSTHQRPSPPPYQSPSKGQAFQPSTVYQGLPACALCLATKSHDTRMCRSDVLWDGSPARCQKSKEGRLVNPAGITLCSDWNSRRGCTSNGHEQRHECSGCGNKEHGAQKCPRAQKD